MLLYLTLIDSEEDKSKFEVIYIKYKNKMFKIANSILHDDYAAEDVVHDVFLKLIDLLDRIEDVDSKQTNGLIYLITQHAAIDKYRSKKTTKIILMDNNEMPEETSSEDISNIIFDEMAVKDMLKDLPKLQQEIMVLRYSYGLSEKQTAKMLNISEDNVHKAAYRAKRKLYRKLSNQ